MARFFHQLCPPVVSFGQILFTSRTRPYALAATSASSVSSSIRLGGRGVQPREPDARPLINRFIYFKYPRGLMGITEGSGLRISVHRLRRGTWQGKSWPQDHRERHSGWRWLEVKITLNKQRMSTWVSLSCGHDLFCMMYRMGAGHGVDVD